MNYYIQGNKEKADQIKTAFEQLGYDISWPEGCANPDVINIGVERNGAKYVVAETAAYIRDIIKTHPDYKELELPVEFKDGDIIGFNDCTHNDGSYVDWVGIYKRKRDDSLNQNQHLFHCVVTSIGTFRTGGSWRVFTAYPATKEQRGLLFSKMKEAGYEWDEKKKELRKIQPHYDISNFKPFDKVLGRDYDEGVWICDLYSYYYKGDNKMGVDNAFVCVGDSHLQCIPFEGNEHLLGTTDMCNEQYINW